MTNFNTTIDLKNKEKEYAEQRLEEERIKKDVLLLALRGVCTGPVNDIKMIDYIAKELYGTNLMIDSYVQTLEEMETKNED